MAESDFGCSLRVMGKINKIEGTKSVPLSMIFFLCILILFAENIWTASVIKLTIIVLGLFTPSNN